MWLLATLIDNGCNLTILAISDLIIKSLFWLAILIIWSEIVIYNRMTKKQIKKKALTLAECPDSDSDPAPEPEEKQQRPLRAK